MVAKEKNACLVFLSYFWGFMPNMIWTATIIECIQESWPDVVILLLLQMLNGFIGWHEETKAKGAMKKLQESMKCNAEVYRTENGVTLLKEVPQREVVVGDMVFIKDGKKIPCDCLVVRTGQNEAIKVDTSVIDGETQPKTEVSGGIIKCGALIVRNEC